MIDNLLQREFRLSLIMFYSPIIKILEHPLFWFLLFSSLQDTASEIQQDKLSCLRRVLDCCKNTDIDEATDKGPLTPSTLPFLQWDIDVLPNLARGLGSGSESGVFEAILRPSRAHQPCALKHFKSSDKQYHREVAILCKMHGSQYFPEIYGTTANRCIVMESLGRYTVTGALERARMCGDPKDEDWLNIALNITTGLQELHNAGFVHGDLKPDNIMVHRNKMSSKWQAKIIDLGSAEPIHPRTRPTNTPYHNWTVGQIDHYSQVCPHLAPEILHGITDISVKGDIFSLGLVLHTIGTETGIVPLQDLGTCCLNPNAESRPDTEWVIEKLHEVKKVARDMGVI